jgi:hypothetical protein
MALVIFRVAFTEAMRVRMSLREAIGVFQGELQRDECCRAIAEASAIFKGKDGVGRW